VTANGGGRPSPDAEAARRVLDRDDHGYILQPWQVAYLFALVEDRTPIVPPDCGVGKGWLEARLRETGTDIAGS